jgi:hypothetical protein
VRARKEEDQSMDRKRLNDHEVRKLRRETLEQYARKKNGK